MDLIPHIHFRRSVPLLGLGAPTLHRYLLHLVCVCLLSQFPCTGCRCVPVVRSTFKARGAWLGCREMLHCNSGKPSPTTVSKPCLTRATARWRETIRLTFWYPPFHVSMRICVLHAQRFSLSLCVCACVCVSVCECECVCVSLLPSQSSAGLIHVDPLSYHCYSVLVCPVCHIPNTLVWSLFYRNQHSMGAPCVSTLGTQFQVDCVTHTRTHRNVRHASCAVGLTGPRAAPLLAPCRPTGQHPHELPLSRCACHTVYILFELALLVSHKVL